MTTGHIDDDDDNKQPPAQPLPPSGIVHMLIDSESKRKEDADTRHRYHPSRALTAQRSAASQSGDSKEEKQPSSPLSPSSPALTDSDSDKENLPFSSSAASSSPPSSSPLLPPPRFRPFFRHEWLDVRDADGVWLEAQIIGLTADRLLVHYKGYKKKYDEWLPLSPSDPQAARMAPLHQHTAPRFALPDRTVVPLAQLCSSSPPLPLPIDCLDTTDKWLPAYMIEFDRSTCLCLVRYEGWSAVYNEWLPVESYRIAPRGSHSSASDSVIVNVRPMEDDGTVAASPSFSSCSLTAAQQHRRKSEYAASLDSEGRFRLKLLQHLGLTVVEQGSDGNCLADDMQLLTADGFLFVDQLKARLRHGRTLPVASYDSDSRALHFVPVSMRDVLDRTGPQQLVRFSSRSRADLRIDLLVTADHDMFAATQQRDGEQRPARGFKKRTARSLLASSAPRQQRSFRFLASATNGAGRQQSWRCLPFVAVLGLQTRQQAETVLQLIGFWLAAGFIVADGSLVFTAKTAADRDWLHELLCRRLSGVLPVSERMEDCDWDAATAAREEPCVRVAQLQRADNGERAECQRCYRVCSPRWRSFFASISRSSNKRAHLRPVTPPSTASPPHLTANDEDETVDADDDSTSLPPPLTSSSSSSSSLILDEQHVKPPAADSEGLCRRDWLLRGLSRDQLRLLICGMRRASGSTASELQHEEQQDDGVLLASSARFRDELTLLLLNAGYSSFFDRDVDGSGDDSWRVHYSSSLAMAEPTLQAECDCEQVVSRSARVWCVQLPASTSRLLVVRRVHSVRSSDGAVLAASRPVIVGNCLFRAVSHQLYDSSEHHALVRDRCVSYLQQEAAYFRAFVVGDWDAYIARMRQQGEWGDHVEIQAMSEVYDMPIEIYAYSLHPLRTYRGEEAARGEAGRGRGVMRLSYHFASHYNSVVEAGRRGGLLRAQLPGMVEDDMIEKRRRRWEEAEARQRDERKQVQRGAQRLSEAQEEEQLNRALVVSRSTFNAQSSLSDFDRAVAASMREMSDAEERKVEEVKRESEREELERDEMQAAIKQSEQEDDWQSIEQQQITAAMHDSLALSRTSSTSRPQHHPQPAAVEDEDMKLALALSLAPSLPPPAAASSSSSPLPSSSSSSRPVTASPASSSLPPPPASSAYPSAVRKLLDLGFPVDSCIAAYSLYEGTGGGEDALVQNMMDHMLNMQHRGAGDGGGAWD